MLVSGVMHLGSLEAIQGHLGLASAVTVKSSEKNCMSSCLAGGGGGGGAPWIERLALNLAQLSLHYSNSFPE